MRLPLIDFHTHRPAIQGEWVIQDGIDTYGIHPWHPEQIPTMPTENRILAIGECGLDRCCNSDYKKQEEAFTRCIRLSEEMQKPLILHCVKSIDDCLTLHRKMHVTQHWIWHGFRGKKEQLTTLLHHNFLFSFGPYYNKETLRSCPADRMLLETDDSKSDLQQIYAVAAETRGMNIDELIRQMHVNYHRLFLK